MSGLARLKLDIHINKVATPSPIGSVLPKTAAPTPAKADTTKK